MDPMALGLVSIGPIARNVADATALFLTLSGHARLSPPEQTPTSTLSTIRIGWLGDAGGYWPTEDGILADCEKGLDRLASAGASVDLCNTLPAMEELWQCWKTLRHHALSPGKALYENPQKRALMGTNWQWEISQGLLLNPSAIADAKAQQAVHKEKERDAAETRKRTARKIASTQPLTMGTGPVPVDVGDVVEAYLYEKFYDSIDFIFVPPAGTKSRDLDVRVAAKTITVGLRGRPPCGASASRHGASEADRGAPEGSRDHGGLGSSRVVV